MGAVDCAFCGQQRALAIGAPAKRRERTRLHRVKPCGERRMMLPAAEDRPPGLGELESVAGAVELLGQMAEARVDVSCSLAVVGRGSEALRSLEVLVSACVVAGVVCHPAGHLRQGRGGAELIGRAREQAWRNLVLEVADHRAVHVAAADLAIGVAGKPASRPRHRCPPPRLAARCRRRRWAARTDRACRPGEASSLVRVAERPPGSRTAGGRCCAPRHGSFLR